MFGGFKKWVVDRYIVGSLYRNGFRIMWFPGFLYYICTIKTIQSDATTCASTTTPHTTSSTSQTEIIDHKLSTLITAKAEGSCRSQSNPPTRSMSSHTHPSRSFCRSTTNLGSSFGQSRYKYLLPVCFHCRTHPSICPHLRKHIVLNIANSTFSILFTAFPLTLVSITGSHFKFSMAFFEIVAPLAVIEIAVGILVKSMV